MRLESKIINAFLTEITPQDCEVVEVQNFSFKALEDHAKIISSLSHNDLNFLLKQQNNSVSVKSCKFMDFRFFANSLAGEFKVILSNQSESATFFVTWDGQRLGIIN